MIARLREAARRNTFMAIAVPIFVTFSILFGLFALVTTIALISYAADHYPTFKMALAIFFIAPAVGLVMWAIGRVILDGNL